MIARCSICGEEQETVFRNFVCYECAPWPAELDRSVRKRRKPKPVPQGRPRLDPELKPYATVFYRICARAKKKSFPCTITLQDLASHMEKPCVYCGGTPTGLDRVDSSLGYVPENVVGACGTCNKMKGAMSADEFFAHCERILSCR